MPIGTIRTREVVVARRHTTVSEAARLMRNHHVGDVVVVDEVDGRKVPCGIVTDRDIVIRAVAEGIDPRTLTVGEVASHHVVAITADQSLDDALALMEQYQVRRLPVIERDDEVVGILAQADIAREVREKRAGEVLEEISKPG